MDGLCRQYIHLNCGPAKQWYDEDNYCLNQQPIKYNTGIEPVERKWMNEWKFVICKQSKNLNRN